MAEHNTLTDPNLHEPKGASTASEGMVYVADGAGSGVWTYSPQGFARYKGTGAAQVIGTTPIKLINNGLDVTTETDYLPLSIRGTGQLWNTSTNKITPIAVGDAYVMRLNLPFTAKTGTPTILNISVDIGGGATITNEIISLEHGLIKAVPYSLSKTVNFDVGTTFLANGGQLFLSVDTGTITFQYPTIQITRIHGETP